MTPDERDHAFVRYLDGACPDAEIAALNTLLTSDPEARAALRAMATQAVLLNDLARERPQIQDRTTKRLRFPVVHRWVAAAAVLLVVGALALWQTRGESSQAIVTQVSGSVAWQGDDGRRGEVQPEQSITTGSLIVEGETASVHLRLRDGSTVMLNGPTELSLPRSADDPLALRHGSLTAEVRPRPPERPLRIRTPTAQIDVLGTVLRVDAQPEQTMLVVDEGRVRLQRLVDAAEVVVQQNQLVEATLEPQAKLVARTIIPAPSSWAPSFVSKPTSGWHGTWLAATGDLPPRMQSALDLSHRRPDGTPVPAYTISAKGGSSGLVTIQSDSHLRFRFRQKRDEDILVLLSLRRPGGGFAGNFQTKIPVRTLAKDSQGWRTWEIPLASLTNGWPKGSTMLVGNRVGLLYLACHQAGTQMEVADLTIGSTLP